MTLTLTCQAQALSQAREPESPRASTAVVALDPLALGPTVTLAPTLTKDEDLAV